MTLLERRELYWNMYFCAEGLKRMAPELINQYNDKIPFPASESEIYLPKGMCYMAQNWFGESIPASLPELSQQRPYLSDVFWFKKSDWKIRQAAILEAIKLTYDTDN